MRRKSKLEELVNSNWTWEEAIKNYLAELSFSKKSPVSIRVRLYFLNSLKNFADQNDIPMGKVNRMTLMRFLSTKELASATQATQTCYLTHFFSYLVDNFVILQNPAAKLESPKITNKEKVILSTDEIKAVYNMIEKVKRNIISTRDLLIFDLTLTLALRVKEVAGLRIKDLFLDDLKIRVIRKGGAEQFLPLTNELAEQMKNLLDQRDCAEQNEHLFLSARYNKKTEQYDPLAIRSIQHNISKYLKMCCKEEKNSYGPHLLRHTGATAMADDGMDVKSLQRLLGHTNVNNTMIYTHTNIEKIRSGLVKHR